MGETVKLSLIIAILDSHEIVRRYMLYLRNLNLPDNIEIIFVDDGSYPALRADDSLKNFKLLFTNDMRKWTQGLARMKGVEESSGEYLFFTDIDHIISEEAFYAGLEFQGDKMIFQRRFAYLDQDGKLIRDRDKVIEWGLNPKAIRDEYLGDGVHGNTYIIRRSIFEELGGYNRKRCNSGTHLQGEDREFNGRYSKGVRAGKYKPHKSGPPIYFFPMGKYHIADDENPHGLFHTLYKERWSDWKPT